MTKANQSAKSRETVPLPMREPAESDQTRSNPIGLLLILALFLSLWFFTNVTTFVVAIGLLISIFLHEVGHFVTARWTGMKATQFFLFMGPRIWSFRRGETEYGVRAYPLGAFVRIVGMNNLDPPAAEDEDRSYMSKSYPKRMLVITAGSLMHMFIAIALLTGLSSVAGDRVPVLDSPWEISAVGGPAREANLELGDVITAVDDVEVSAFSELRDYLEARPGETVELTYLRDGQPGKTEATLGASELGEGQLCLRVDYEEHTRVRQSPAAGVTQVGSVIYQTAQRFDEAIGATWGSVQQLNEAEEVSLNPTSTDCVISHEANRLISVWGFLSIAGELQAIDESIRLLAGINIVLGVFNMLPFLPLDGGHAAVATYERLRSRRGKRYYADFNKMVPLTYMVMALLVSVGVLTIALDIVRPLTTN